MKAAYFSPMPPARTGVADYSAALVRALRQFVEVEVNPRSARGIPIYNLGNNPLHREIHHRACAEPGIVILHDAVLQHFHLGYNDRDRYVSEFVYNYGEWARGLGGSLWEHRAASAHDPLYFRYPMLKRAVEGARAVVVHNPAAARAVREHAPHARIEEIPHLFEPPGSADIADLPPGKTRFGVFGFLRESKRLMAVLHCFHRLRSVRSDIELVVAGEFASDDLDRAARPYLEHAGVVRVPYLPEEDFWKLARAVDVCVNLRYPLAGETSGIAIRLMGIGKPVIVTEGEEYARFPEAACLRVDAGAAERETLLAFMMLLADDATLRYRIGEAAASHVRTHHAPAIAARMLADLMNFT